MHICDTRVWMFVIDVFRRKKYTQGKNMTLARLNFLCRSIISRGISVSNAEAVNDGKHVAQMYGQQYRESQSKHKQTISGNVILVNYYTQRQESPGNCYQSHDRGV